MAGARGGENVGPLDLDTSGRGDDAPSAIRFRTSVATVLAMGSSLLLGVVAFAVSLPELLGDRLLSPASPRPTAISISGAGAGAPLALTKWPAAAPRSREYTVTVNGMAVDVLQHQGFSWFSMSNDFAAPVTVRVVPIQHSHVLVPIASAVVRPLRHHVPTPPSTCTTPPSTCT